jgi:LacI family gluconate utilization system Gnt-I transcriptional repressor
MTSSPRPAPAPRVRIEDVAAAAGVSAMTVSRALRGVDGVGPARRAEIERIAAAMNYVPNGNARSLVASHSTLVGISVPNLMNDVFPEILLAMRRTLTAAGFDTVIDTTEYDAAREEAWVRRLIGWSPAAVVLTGVHHTPRVRQWLRASGVPTLEFWDWTADPIDICVGIDHEAAGRTLGAHVCALGYRRPAFVGVAQGHDLRADARLRGLRDSFRLGAGVPVAAVETARDPSFSAGFQGTQALLAQDGPRPDVVFYLSDHLAFGGMMALQAAGLSAPEDIGVAGFNALNITTVLPTALTTLRTPRHEMGLAGARNILARIHGVAPPRAVCLPAPIVAGDTTRRQTDRSG